MRRERLPERPELLGLRIIKQGKPTGAYTDGRMPIDDLEPKDAAEIRAGQAEMLEIQLTSKNPRNSSYRVIDSVINRVGPPDAIGGYSHPEQIIDFPLRWVATDLWASEFRALVGTVVSFRSRPYRVESLEADSDGYSEEGSLTGYAICRRTDYAPSGTPCNPKRLPLHELKPYTPRQQTDQSVSKEEA
jgi:hypothetical protein